MASGIKAVLALGTVLVIITAGSSLSTSCSNCFPEDSSHLRSPCGMRPDDIALPEFEEQQTANCPFLGTLTNEGVIPFDWIMNETVWRASAFASDRNGNQKLPHLAGHFAGNFRDHSTWVDHSAQVNSSGNTESMGSLVDCFYWYVNPLKMEGLGNEHSSSVGISDCPTDWTNCGFDCSNAGEWKCKPREPNYSACKAGLPNNDRLNKFIKELTGDEDFDDESVVTSCDLRDFMATVESVHSSDVPTEISLVEDFHFNNPTASFSTQCNHSFDEDGTFLTQTGFPTGGAIGGGIVGGYLDLLQYFGKYSASDGECSDGKVKFVLPVKDLRRIDIERKLPCDFDRAGLFKWMKDHNGVTDRRQSESNWFAGCSTGDNRRLFSV